MKTKHLLLLLIMALVAPWVANAQTQTLTVCDGDDGFNNNFIPIAGTYVDTQGTISEFIIPSTTEGMADMVGASISKLTFYLTSVPSDTWGNPTFQWYMGEVEGTTLNSAYGPSSFTTVATGVWGNQSSTLEVEFDTPYVYGGGNLLIGSYLQSAAGWAVVNYLGIYTGDNTAVYHSYHSSTQEEFDSPQKFLPKTTFTYETCQKPSGLTVNDVTNSSVALSWTENGSATHWQIDCCTNPNFTCPPYYDEVSNTPSYSITQWLESGTTYYARVRAVCGNGWYSEWSDAVSFTTKHEPVAVGDSWTDNFEGYTCGWDFFNGTQTNQWVWGTATNNTEGGSKALYISNDGGTSNDYTNNSASVVYATKPFTFAQSGYYGFLYDWKNHGEGLFGDTGAPTPFDYLRVVLAPGTVALTPGELLTDLGHNWLPNGWIALDGGHCLSGQDEWLRNYEETYLQAGTYTMVFVWRNDDSGGYYPAAIDNVSINSVSCPRPTGLTIDNVTNNYVYYHFDSEPGAAYQYTIAPSNTTYTEEQLFQYVTPRVAQSTTFSGAYSMYGEDLDTDYYFYLRRKCGEDDYSATVTVLFHSSDLCADLLSNDLPYTEDFEEYIVGENVFWGVPLSECWDAYNSSIDELCGMFPLVNVDSNNGNKRLYFASVIGSQIVDPQDQYAILPPMEDVNHLKMTFNAKTDSDYISPIHVGVMVGKDPTTFTSIADFNAINNNGQYTEYTVSFENYTGNGNRIAIKLDKATEANSFRILYVDNITVEKNCYAPSNVAVSDIMHTSATVSWTGESGSYILSYRKAKAPNGVVLFNEDFEDETSFGNWVFTSMNEANASNAGRYAEAAHSDSYGFRFSSCNYIENESSETYDQYLVSPELTVTGWLQFYFKKTMHYTENLYVGYSTTTNELSAFTWTEDIVPTEEWQDYQLELPDNVKYIAFHYFGDYRYYVYIDDIAIIEGLPAGNWQTVDVTDNTTTANLSGLTFGTRYDVKVQASCGAESEVVSFTTLSDNYKFFVTEGNWNEPDNWFPVGVPTIDQDVELRTNVTIPSGCEAFARSIKGTGSGVVNHTITIEDGGKLKHLNSDVFVTVKKAIRGYITNYDPDTHNNGDYYLIANPMRYNFTPSQDGSDGFLVGNYDFYSFDYEKDHEWMNYKAGEFSVMETSVNYPYGYLYANETGTTLIFTGKVNAYTGSKSKAIWYPSNPTAYVFPGWYLVGNPYLYDAYLSSESSNGIAQPYIKMNAAGDGFENVAAGTPIAPLEGFFYQGKPSDLYVYVVTTEPAIPSNRKLDINLQRDGKQLDNAILVFGGEQSLGKFTFREGSSKVYMPVEGKDLAITSVEGQVGEMPVNFKAEKNGTYTLSFANKDVTFSYLHLIDNLTGADVDLLNPETVIAGADPQSPTVSYTFTAKMTDYESRFKLLFATGSSASPETDTFGFINGSGNFCVFGIEGEATLQVIDMMGHVISSETFSGSYEKRINGAPGVYMVRLINGNDVRVQKVVVR